MTLIMATMAMGALAGRGDVDPPKFDITADGLTYNIESEEDATAKCISYLWGSELKRVVVPERVTDPATGKSYAVTSVRLRGAPENENVEEIVIEAPLKKIDEIRDFFSLRSITLPDGLEEITTFCNMPALKDVSLPESIETIGGGSGDAFVRLGLETLTLPASVNGLDHCAFYNLPDLTEIEMPGVMQLSQHTLTEMPKLKKLELAPCFIIAKWNSVDAPLDEIRFRSDGVESEWLLSLESFTHCPKEIYCERTNPPTFIDDNGDPNGEGRMFGGTEKMKSVKLYVPLEAVEAYRATPYWGNMQIIAYDFELGRPVEVGIDGIHTDAVPADDRLFDLSGREVTTAHPAPGIYIRAGHKVAVR